MIIILPNKIWQISINKLNFAAHALQLKLFHYSSVNHYPSKLSQWDSTQVMTFLYDIRESLMSQLDNPLLLSNDYVYQHWLRVYKIVDNLILQVNLSYSFKEAYVFNNKYAYYNRNLLEKMMDCYDEIKYLYTHFLGNMENYFQKESDTIKLTQFPRTDKEIQEDIESQKKYIL